MPGLAAASRMAETATPDSDAGSASLNERSKIEASVDTKPSGENEDSYEVSRLRALGADIQEQDDLERNINRQADQLLTEQANDRDQKRLDKTKTEKHKLESQIRKIRSKLSQPILPPAGTVRRLQEELDHYLAQIETKDDEIKDIENRITEREVNIDEFADESAQGGRLPGESQKDFLVRTGKITPFDRLAQPAPKISADLRETLLDAEQNHMRPEDEEPDEEILKKDQRSHVHLRRPGFDHSRPSSSSEDGTFNSATPTKRRKTGKGQTYSSRRHTHSSSREMSEESDFRPGSSSEAPDGAIEFGTSDEEEEDFQPELATKKRRKQPSKRSGIFDGSEGGLGDVEDLAGVDDGNESLYEKRLSRWIKSRSSARKKAREKTQDPHELPAGEDEWHLPHPSEPDLELTDGYKLPGDVYPALFDYQKTGVQWLSELFKQEVGGIVGDEMGLGKTIQIISFLAGLHYSKMVKKPVIVVCPATVMKQWVNEFHTWWPPFRVSILHSSGSGMIDVGRESRTEDGLVDRMFSARAAGTKLTKSQRAAQQIVSRVVQEGHILVTTYAGLQNYAEFLIPVDWEYAVLDEGHKIRNPNASITIHCKELRTANRIILSGTPIQNNLVELWSLFDFVYPMRLGTLVDFKNEFETPIRQGGYANASNLQVMTASKCAETLKDSIQPYLLQRLKADVAADLPKKTEQVLFCKLTEAQRMAYKRFLDSDEMKSIEQGRRQMLYGVDILRKICNHPDLSEHKVLANRKGYDYGNPRASGKMLVVKELLDIWCKSGHKTLLFCQNRIMLDILQKYIGAMAGIKFCRMDGTTPIKERQTLVDRFNTDQALHVFLLTTKVGGLGVNLTGADRVIIFDPDWNPSTDMQARERAWRLGQKREVQIYRLMMAGTIEEKIFHRQIFKQFLTNKILKDPKQRQTFQMKDLHDLFVLGDEYKDGTETGKMFKGTETQIEEPSAEEKAEALPLQGNAAPGEVSDGDPFAPGSATLTSFPYRPAEESKTREMNDSLLSVKGISAIKSGELSEPEKIDTSDTASEQRLLTGIFARSGVASTVEHDRIVNGRIEYAADSRILQRQADKVAAEAAKSLREAEKVAKQTPVGVPTWTGDVGTAGRPPSPPLRTTGRSIGGSGSAGVLNSLRDRRNERSSSNGSNVTGGRLQAKAGARASGGRRDRGGDNQGPSAQEFGTMIRDFLLAHGGTVYTQMLLDQFSHKCRTDRHSAEFKAMLNEIATLQKGRGGRGQWTIKPEYRKR